MERDAEVFACIWQILESHGGKFNPARIEHRKFDAGATGVQKAYVQLDELLAPHELWDWVQASDDFDCVRDGNSMVVSWAASSAASGATSSADHAPAMLKRRALGSQSCHITDLPFGAEGYRHCVLIIIKSVGGLRLTQVVLGQTCRSLHTWFSSRFDEADGLQQQPTTSQQGCWCSQVEC